MQLTKDIKDNTNYFSMYKRMFPYIKPYLFRVIVSFLITIPIGAMDAAIIWMLKPYMDQVLIKQHLSSSWYIPVAIVGYTILQGVLNYISTYLNGWLGRNITNNIKYDLYIKLLQFEPAFYDKNASGIVISRFSSDPDSAASGLLDNIKNFLTKTFSSIFLVGTLVYLSWKLSIIAIGVLLCIFLPLAKIRKKLKRITEGLLKASGLVLNVFTETYAGNKIISAYNLKEHQSKRFKEALKEQFNLNMKITRINGWINPTMHTISSIGVALVIWYGSYLVLSKSIPSSSLVSFIITLLLLYTPIKGMGNATVSTHMSFLSISRILNLFDYEPKIKNNNNAARLDSINAGISFENVCFEYNEEKPILKGINLQVKMGESLAIVGNSGGGKTTLVNLIPRFYDVNAGTITIDGVDIKDIELNSLRDKIAVVFQDNFLFDGTIRSNILLGKPNATEEEIVRAVNDAFLDEFVASLEHGLDTHIGERGTLLSGGQKQRIAIARALLKNAPIVILDEATSALDNKSEAIVQKAIDRLMENRTVFVIAHRLSTVQNADKIAVIDDGLVVELGNHEELVQIEDGIYKNLYLAQFKQKHKSLEASSTTIV